MQVACVILPGYLWVLDHLGCRLFHQLFRNIFQLFKQSTVDCSLSLCQFAGFF